MQMKGISSAITILILIIYILMYIYFSSKQPVECELHGYESLCTYIHKMRMCNFYYGEATSSFTHMVFEQQQF